MAWLDSLYLDTLAYIRDGCEELVTEKMKDSKYPYLAYRKRTIIVDLNIYKHDIEDIERAISVPMRNHLDSWGYMERKDIII